jgi:putative nucleotidyltransferase with HDIG domain
VTPSPRFSWPARLVLAALFIVLWAVLNRAASLFEVRPGLSFFFPAAAITVVAGATLGWLGALSVFLANFLLPWGQAAGIGRTALFALPGALWAAIIAALPLPSGFTWPRLRRFLLLGVIAGSLVAAVAGGALLTWLAGPRDWAGFTLTVTLWWVPDLTAALSFGLAGLVLVSPSLVLSGDDRALWRAWLAGGREIGKELAIAFAGFLLVLAAARVFDAPVQWFVVLLLPPVVIASLRGGLGAGLLINAVVSALYLGLTLVSLPAAKGDLVVALFSTYANLWVFAAFAVLAGVLAGRNRQLVEHVRRQGEVLSRGLEETVEALAAAMQTKDRGSSGHVERVSRLAVLVGRELGVRGDELRQLRRAAILHDVGKIGVPEAILNKAAELEAAERAVLEEHVEMGVTILERVEFLHPVLAIVRYHQERWDGDRSSAHPAHYGLSGTEIPMGSRILGAVEAFDAMTHDRPYRKAMSREAGVAELWRCSGTQFDPVVVAALTRVIAEKWDISGDDLAKVDSG